MELEPEALGPIRKEKLSLKDLYYYYIFQQF